MEVKGQGGTIRTGGRIVARLGDWSLEGRTDDWVVAGEVDWCHPLWCAGPGPFELRLALTKGAWMWRDVPIVLHDEGRGGMRISGKERWTLIGV